MNEVRKRILTGDTPTGKLHLGHYVGTLENRVKLQSEYETFVIIADVHALSTLAKEPRLIGQYTREVLLDNLAVGLDPEQVTFFVESGVPELYELASFLSMYVSHARVLRNPTIKDEIQNKKLGDSFSLGFVNYPILQAADILSVRAHLVPVGVDQVAHLEQARELARDVNTISGKPIFPIPEARVGVIGKLIGTDGNPKMSKSAGNTIFLSDTSDKIREKVMSMYTDPKRIHATDPGTVEGNPLFVYLDAFSAKGDHEKISEYKERYRKGTVGDVEVKQYLVDVLEHFIAPMRNKRREYEKDDAFLMALIERGNEKVRHEAAQVLDELKGAFQFFV